MTKNLTASVRQRLMNLARARSEEFGLILTRYGIERLLYRLSQSPYRKRVRTERRSAFRVVDRPSSPPDP